ncbi:MAG: methyltransferase domain-containing protein [Blastocatellales bacterium]
MIETSSSSSALPMDFTGERMVPESAPSYTFWEHVYRYRFASQFVNGKRVLDIACGEGYGSAALLEAGAKSIIGIDVSEEACQHARSKYGIDARSGDAESIPLQNNSVDLIVSFETIEHINNPTAFIKECARILTPGGTLIVSTPNGGFESEEGSSNPFHVHEMEADEFEGLLKLHFSQRHWYTQRPIYTAWWSPRSLVASTSPWLHLRGFCRAMQIFRRILCPEFEENVGERCRQAITQVILTEDRAFSSMVNPYAIRKRSVWQQEQPKYFVVVATL